MVGLRRGLEKGDRIMGARAWLAILAMGLGCVVVMGLLTKVAVDSSPELQAMIRFKAAFAEDFASRQVEEVQLRKAVEKRGHVLIVTLPRPAATATTPAFDTEVAEYFVARYEGKPGASLKIEYISPAVFGCTGNDPVRSPEIALGPVRLRVTDRAAARRLAGRLGERHRSTLVGFERGERDLTVEVQGPGDYDGAWDETALKLEPEARLAFAGNPYVALIVKVYGVPRPAAPEPGGEASPADPVRPAPRKLLGEVRFDRLGRELGPNGKPTGRGGAPLPTDALTAPPSDGSAAPGTAGPRR